MPADAFTLLLLDPAEAQRAQQIMTSFATKRVAEHASRNSAPAHPFMAGRGAMSSQFEPQTIVDCKDAAELARLSYASTDDRGLARRRAGKGFSYRGPDGKNLTDKSVLARARSRLPGKDWDPPSNKAGQTGSCLKPERISSGRILAGRAALVDVGHYRNDPACGRYLAPVTPGRCSRETWGLEQPLASLAGSYLNRKFARESWSIEVHPISLIPRTISARRSPSARSTPASPAAAKG